VVNNGLRTGAVVPCNVLCMYQNTHTQPHTQP
jgi:hypothetical protein